MHVCGQPAPYNDNAGLGRTICSHAASRKLSGDPDMAIQSPPWTSYGVVP